MTILLSILSFLAVIVVLIMAHELGHFITAKASGVRVEEFGLGFPPRLLSVKRGETIYSLNAMLIGGFVKMAGEEDPTVPGSLASKSTITRIMVLGAGSAMNLLLPLLLFSIAFMVPHNLITEPIVVKEVVAASPAATTNIRPGDTILSVNGKAVDNRGDLARYIQLNLGKETTLLIEHNDSTKENIAIIPRWKPPEGEGAVGIEFDIEVMRLNQTLTRENLPFWEAIPLGATTSIETFVLFKNGIVSMIIGAVPVVVTGPVGIAQLTGEVAKSGVSPLLQFAAFLSINLAIINIFPLPALDGGRIAFVLLERIRRGRRISAKTEGLVHFMGFALIITFFLALTYKDIIRIVSGESLIP